ncbi:MAG TPA: malto-oligosyltrehalose trehalohydrolase [Candidatus Limnocylindrales bacterium]|nr:malto-oligosyltrehalose trehalohydrolase [Candidatus Limnocylindrales bacterium]
MSEVTLRVWAPDARAVEAIVDDQVRPLRQERDGAWTCALEAGQRYRLRVDGNGPFPDPASRWQPEGVHGPSQAIALEGVEWNDAAFAPVPLSKAVIYELHVGTFSPSGTYAGVIEKLPYLRDLGVTHVELMPLATFPGSRGWGYDGVYPYAPHPAYGTPHELRRLVQAAHDHGLAVLLDVVYNHLGPDGNYLASYGPYFTDRYRTPWGPAINFDDAGSDSVRAFFIENALMWLRDYRFDGLRLDAVHAIYDMRATHFLEELSRAVAGLEKDSGRALLLIAESDANDPRLVWPVSRGGFGLHAHWMDDFHHALHSLLTGERDGYYSDFGSFGQLARAWQRGYVFAGDYSGFRRRSHGREPNDVRCDQLVVFSQNHDQIGNRGFGERLSQLLEPPALKVAAALTLLSPFVPLLFQGEEWAASTPFLYFTDHQDAELARAVREGRRREFASFQWRGEVPDPQAPETFEASRLRWEEIQDGAHDDMLRWYRELLRLRRDHPIDAADVQVDGDERQRVLVLRRGSLLVAANVGTEPALIAPPQGPWRIVLRSQANAEWQRLPGPGVIVAVRG